MEIIIKVTQDELKEMDINTIDELSIMFYESDLDDNLVGYNVTVELD